jgi:Malic enzyme, NAD binding domain
MSAARNSGSKITDMRIMCVGAGSAGLGVCSLLMAGMVEAGLSEEEVWHKCMHTIVCISYRKRERKSNTCIYMYICMCMYMCMYRKGERESWKKGRVEWGDREG